MENKRFYRKQMKNEDSAIGRYIFTGMIASNSYVPSKHISSWTKIHTALSYGLRKGSLELLTYLLERSKPTFNEICFWHRNNDNYSDIELNVVGEATWRKKGWEWIYTLCIFGAFGEAIVEMSQMTANERE